MITPNYGSADGLSDRLREWADRLARDKRYPWIGLGIMKDLEAAADVLDGKPVKPPIVEFDL